MPVFGMKAPESVAERAAAADFCRRNMAERGRGFESDPCPDAVAADMRKQHVRMRLGFQMNAHLVRICLEHLVHEKVVVVHHEMYVELQPGFGSQPHDGCDAQRHIRGKMRL